MEGLVMTAQIILSLSILVGVHELGHLVAAKVFGMRVEQFSIGFPPKIFGFKYGETEYALSAIPLGGYVKISGMIDESLDTEAMKEEPKPWEFRAKPAWQRLIVMLGGIIVNVVTGVIIFVFLTYVYGEIYLPKDEINKNGGILALDLGKEIELKTGDKILKINGNDFEDFSDIANPNTLLSEDGYYTVERDGKIIEVKIPGNFIEKFNSEGAAYNFVLPRIPAVVDETAKGSIAEKVGLVSGDQIIEVEGEPVHYVDEVRSVLLKTGKTDTLDFKIARAGQQLTFKEYFKNDSTIGFSAQIPDMKEAVLSYSFAESIPIGTKKAFGIVFLQLRAFSKMFSGQLSVTKSLSGPIGIAKNFGGEWQWQRFWRLTGLLSMVLAFMNLLPIPALDGGHVMFLIYEIVSGRKPSDKFLETAQKIGMILLLSLMVFVIFNDIFKIEFIQRLFGLG